MKMSIFYGKKGVEDTRYFYLDAQPQLAKRIDKNLAISLLLVFGKLG